jgi:hypothetical protein
MRVYALWTDAVDCPRLETGQDPQVRARACATTAFASAPHGMTPNCTIFCAWGHMGLYVLSCSTVSQTGELWTVRRRSAAHSPSENATPMLSNLFYRVGVGLATAIGRRRRTTSGSIAMCCIFRQLWRHISLFDVHSSHIYVDVPIRETWCQSVDRFSAKGCSMQSGFSFRKVSRTRTCGAAYQKLFIVFSSEIYGIFQCSGHKQLRDSRSYFFLPRNVHSIANSRYWKFEIRDLLVDSGFV